MASRVLNVLFLCTGNSARSIMAEAILRRDDKVRFRAFSAGSQPKGEVHPLALTTLQDMGYPVAGLASKSWEIYGRADVPEMNFVFTVCDRAAGEVCPVWPGQPMTAHWGIDDPAAVSGTLIEQKTAFVTALKQLKTRISLFINLPFNSLDRLALKARLREIGRSPGASPGVLTIDG